MKTNFRIEENIYVIDTSGRMFDLHNDYDFMKADVNQEKKIATIVWKEVEGNNLIIIEHFYIQYLILNCESLDEDSKTLSTISFFTSKMRDLNDNITSQEKPEEEDDIIYFFENENYIRIQCDETIMSVREET